jgi:predicted Rossmann fold flavoprotein
MIVSGLGKDIRSFDLIVVGAGAAGYFAAINVKIKNPRISVLILEQSGDVLAKVRISGGGRCNVMHDCFDVRQLIQYYPRGSKELLGPFHRFGPAETKNWFESNGVALKTEADGRMFPKTDDSNTIISCFLRLASKSGIELITKFKFRDYSYHEQEDYKFRITDGQSTITSRMLLMATGSNGTIWKILQTHGYRIIEPVPSLFTFNLPGHAITTLMGLSVAKAIVRIHDTAVVTEGPVLITHWGLSGPAILKASAWAAVALAEKKYAFSASVDWIPDVSPENIKELRTTYGKTKVYSQSQFGLPTRLWRFLISTSTGETEKNWSDISKDEMNLVIKSLKNYTIQVQGKTTFKEEFVTAGGVDLREIEFRKFESRREPGLFMAGEILNIDAVTGGFNFQAAWTGGYLAAQAIVEKFEQSNKNEP